MSAHFSVLLGGFAPSRETLHKPSSEQAERMLVAFGDAELEMPGV